MAAENYFSPSKPNVPRWGRIKVKRLLNTEVLLSRVAVRRRMTCTLVRVFQRRRYGRRGRASSATRAEPGTARGSTNTSARGFAERTRKGFRQCRKTSQPTQVFKNKKLPQSSRTCNAITVPVSIHGERLKDPFVEGPDVLTPRG